MAIGLALVAVAGFLGWRKAAPPGHCAEGMVALRDGRTGTPRCCGRGQSLLAGGCQGPPTSCAKGMLLTPRGCVAGSGRVFIAAGHLRLDPIDWEGGGATPQHEVEIPGFWIDAYEVTEADWEMCHAGRACAPRPPTEEPGRALAGITRAEAALLCQWRGGRLPSSAELTLAATGPTGRRYPWGETGAVCRRAAFGLWDGPCARGAKGPELSGSHPAGATPEGVHDLAGNVAEWTAPLGDAPAEVHGGSWQDPLASALRSWSARQVPADARSSDIGVRCAYDAAGAGEAARDVRF